LRDDRRRLVLALCLLSNVLAGLVSTLMSAYLPDAVRELAGSADGATVGHVGAYIGSLFLVGWATGGIALGWLADRFGRARTFTFAVFLFAIASLAAATSGSWLFLVACRLVTGAGIGGTMVVSAILVAEAWSERERAIALGFLGVSYPIGIISSGVISYTVSDWRTGFLVGLLPLVLALISAAVVRDPVQPRGRDPSSFAALVSPAHRRDLLAGAAIFGTMSVGIWATFSWLPAWAEDLIGTAVGGQQQRGILMVVLGCGGIVGGAFSGLLSNMIGRRGTLLVGFAGAFSASMLLFRTNVDFTPVVFVETALLAVFFGISQGALTIYIPELFPTRIRATATGVCFNVGRIVTALAVFFVGVLVPVLGGYGSAISVFSTIYLVGFAATLLGHETRGQQVRATPPCD
jgi:MFS family permease